LNHNLHTRHIVDFHSLLSPISIYFHYFLLIVPLSRINRLLIVMIIPPVARVG
jgi:hypothetical protein